jgi:phosphatidylserine/phosphatidylglycerophosphate/cardiolipin synthase-like enzyme
MRSIADLMKNGYFAERRHTMLAEARRSTSARNPAISGIVAPGRNVWRIAKATRAAVLVDADCYFTRLEQALRLARRSVWILGWDLNGKIRLHPDDETHAETLGQLLRSLVEKHNELEIRLLIWAMGPIYSGRSMRLFREGEWADHPRIHLRYDGTHPFRGSHHQKVICIDDSIAFAGGIDLTAKRWDTFDHTARLPARCTPDGTVYTPVHDIQMAVEGEAARALGDLARARWRFATGEDLPAGRSSGRCWPSDLDPDFTGIDVAISRTQSSAYGRDAHEEAFQLNRDALMSARRHIYIETQYFASPEIADLLADRLTEKHGPEIIVLVTHSSRGVIERFVMGSNRDRLIRRLLKADRFGRLRVMYPVVPYENGDECEILIHSKVMIVDDHFLRIGSSNLNNRSEGLDTECDLAVEARTRTEMRAIAGLRDRLIAEHLGTTPAKVKTIMKSEGSLVRAIDRLNTNGRGLRPIPVDPDGSTAQLVGTGLLDPRRPYWPLQKAGRLASSLMRRVSGGFL